MAVKPSSYMILALIRGGLTSGYAIKRFIEQQRMEVFWATTFAQIYPELAQLEKDGYLTHSEDPHGGRQRLAYSLTDKGEHALLSWLRCETIPLMELRDEGLLRLAFADHLPREEAIELVQRLRVRAEEGEREFRETILPLAESLLAAGLRFPIEIARMGAGYYAWSIEHLTGLEEDLRAEQRAAS
ncbi:MAG: PadR family transcriptional regulator [Actinomycetota bacterium]|nr:PadR family transcriptional regulator [Actinomycetota bacterium]